MKMMASISMVRYVGCSWHVTQAVRTGHYAGKPAPLLDSSSSTGHGKTSGHGAGRTIVGLLKSAQSVASSAKEAIGRASGKPLAAIEALPS